MDSVEDYARQWAKREKEDLDTLSEWVKSVRSLIQIIIKKKSVGLCALALNQSINDKYVVVSADKAPNNIVFVCKSHYKDCLIKELGIDTLVGKPTYTPTTVRKRRNPGQS